MASPFQVFRKYLKPLMVVLGVMIMFSFVLLDPLSKLLLGGSGVGGANGARDTRATAVSWKGGSLTNRELQELVQRRRLVRDFLDNVEGLGAQPSYMAGVEPSPLRVIPLRLASTPQQGVEQSVVQTKLFADAARKAGMTVDNASIVQYLRQLGRERVSPADMRNILKGVSGGGVPIDYVFDAIRDELLARNYLVSNLYAFQTVTPQQRWLDWLRVNDRVVIEAAGIPVESYLTDVKDPTEKEIEEFYEEYKNREAAPELIGQTEIASAQPGFRIPRKIDVQYIQASFTDALTKAEAEVTEEEIAKFYEENKDLFIKADTGLLDDFPAVDEVPATNTPGTDEASNETGENTEPGDQSATEAAVESEPAETPEASPEAPATEQAPEAEQPAATETPATTEQPPEGEKSSALPKRSSVFSQAAFLQEGEASEVEKIEEGEAAEAPAATEDSPATTATGDETTPPVGSVPPTDTPSQTAGEAVEAAPATTATEKPKEYQPLEEVSDIIRRDIAYRRVAENLAQQMKDLEYELMAEFKAYYGQVLDARSRNEKEPEPPAALLDLAPLAEKHGFTVGKTGPMPWLELRDTPIGKSVNPETSIPLSSILFANKDVELFQPQTTVNVESSDFYIVMKTSDTPATVPKLEDVRNEVVRAWKVRKAAEIALKDAEKQAKAAQEAGSPLADFFAGKSGVEIVKVDPFSQMTRGDVPDQFGNQRFRLSQPEGIIAPGPAFLREVFKLKDGQVGAVLNNDQSMVYIVRVVEHQNSQDELRNAYLAEANTWDGLPAMTDDHVTIGQRSVGADLSGGGVDWKRPPDRRAQEEGGEEEEPSDS